MSSGATVRRSMHLDGDALAGQQLGRGDRLVHHP